MCVYYYIKACQKSINDLWQELNLHQKGSIKPRADSGLTNMGITLDTRYTQVVRSDVVIFKYFGLPLIKKDEDDHV